MASGNSFAALADNDDEVPNQASKKPQAVAGAIAHVSTAGQKGQGKDMQPVISDRAISRRPGGDKPAHSGAGPRRADRQSGGRADAAPARVVLRNCAAGGRTQRVSGSKSDVVKVSSPACVQRIAPFPSFSSVSNALPPPKTKVALFHEGPPSIIAEASAVAVFITAGPALSADPA